MRKHIYYFIGAMLLVFSFFSCSKKDNCDPTDRESPCYTGVGAGSKLLLTEHKVNAETLAKFEYDSQNRRTRYILKSGTIEYSYNAKGLLSAIYKDITGKITQREDYTYAADDKPVSMVISDPNNKDDIPVDVQYTYSKNKIIETSMPRRTGADVTTNTFLFNEQGNLTDIITVMNGVEFTNSWSEFDDKPSTALHGDPYYWKNSKNNAQRFRVTSSAYNLDQKWIYTYNAEGYPIKALIYNNGSEDVAEEHVFSYKTAR